MPAFTSDGLITNVCTLKSLAGVEETGASRGTVAPFAFAVPQAANEPIRTDRRPPSKTNLIALRMLVKHLVDFGYFRFIVLAYAVARLFQSITMLPFEISKAEAFLA